MRATKYILTLIFIVTLTASAFGAWTSQESTTYDLNAIDGISTTGMTTLCAVGDDCTILISNDYGANWTQTSTPAGMAATDGADTVSIFGSNIWIGTSAGEIFVSADWGSTWTDKTPAGFSNIHAIKFGSANNGVITGTLNTVPATYGTRYTSNAGGAWNPPSKEPGTSSINGLDSVDANTFYIVGASGMIYKSTDGGDNWTRQGIGVTPYDLRGVNFPTSSTGYAVGAAYTCLKTTDSGSSWEAQTFSGAVTGDYYGVHFASASVGEIGGQEDSSGKGKIIGTSDGGSSFTYTYTIEASSTKVNDLYFLDEDNRFAVGKGGSGIILGNIAPMTVTSVVQTARPTQSQAPRGFTGDVTITGTNFQIGSWGPSNVDFLATGVTVNSVTRNSSTQLTVNITVSDTAQLGDEDVDVANTDGTIYNYSSFTITEKPTINTLTPPSGVQGATISGLIIGGTNFQNGITNSAVSFDSGITVDNVSWNSALEITCDIVVATSAATGKHEITVTNPDGGASAPNTFTVLSVTVPNPTITLIAPTDVTIGATSVDVDVTGTEFHTGITATFETDGITINSVTLNSSTSLTINIDVGANAHTGPRAIIIRNTDGGAATSAENNLYLNVMEAGAATPTITALRDAVGFQGNQDKNVIVYGSNFEDGATIIFYPPTGITINSVTFLSSTQLRANIDIDSNAATGSRDVRVENLTGGYVVKGGAYRIDPQGSKSAISGGRGLAYPAPWNPNKGPVNIQINIDKDDNIDLPIVTMGGRMVHKFDNVDVHAGYNTLTWNGRTFTGHQVPAGMVLGTIISNTEKKKIGIVKIMVVPWH